MKRFCLLCAFVIASSETLGLNLRSKRQTDDVEGGLEDRYGWNGPNPFQYPSQFQNPWQNRWPGQGQNRFPFQRPVFPESNQNQLFGQESLSPTQSSNNNNNNNNNNNDTNNGQETSPSVQACIRDCPVTAEYRPVCGSNRVQYSNPGRLTCAQMCGVRPEVNRHRIWDYGPNCLHHCIPGCQMSGPCPLPEPTPSQVLPQVGFAVAFGLTAKVGQCSSAGCLSPGVSLAFSELLSMAKGDGLCMD